MKCYAPTIAFRQPGINPATGKHYPPVSFRQFSKILPPDLPLNRRVQILIDYYNSCPDGLEPVLMPCKKCLLCAAAYRRMWAYRLMCEATTSQESMFITLTVDEDCMEKVFPGRSLVHKPFQDFMKRLRILMSRGFNYVFVPHFTNVSLLGKLPRMSELRFYQRRLIKYYMCGEYGDSSNRPHYHVCVFGARFPDSYFAKKVGHNAYYYSPTLAKLWPYGKMSFFSDVTARSAAYVAGYVDKKLLKSQDDFIRVGLTPEYVRMSNGIGLEFFNQFHDSMFRFKDDGELFGEFHFLGDKLVSSPSYFDQKFALLSPEKYDKLVAARESRRLASLRLTRVDEVFNESGRKHAVMLARKHEREIREFT